MMMGAHHTASKSRMPEIEDRAWAFALRVGVFGYAEVSAELSISMDAATRIIRGWVDQGRARVQRGGNASGRKMFELTPAYREPTDRASLIAAQLWTAMRGLKQFTPVDLASHCRADLRAEVGEASAYCQSLLKGGYLRVIRTAVPGTRDATYKLVVNSGPRAPRERRVVAVWDPNDGAYAYVSGVGRLERSK